MDQFQHQKPCLETSISNELDISGDLFDGVLVVSGKITGNADQARRALIDFLGDIGPKLLHDEPLEFLAVIQQPVEVEKSLIDHVLIDRACIQ
jgi:hypothetical protein